MSSRESNIGSGKNEANVGGDGNTGKGSGTHCSGAEMITAPGQPGGDGNTGKGSGTHCSGAEMMVAPGQAGERISREAFESNPKAYFADLHVKEKGSPKPNK